jgi:hypothetical protein
MVFTIGVKGLSYKQDLSNIELMLEDQESTYAVLKYAYDIPDEIYIEAIYALEERIGELEYPKLVKLVYEHIESMEEIAEKTLFSNTGSGPISLIEE